MDREILEKAGMTKAEADVYITLISIGPTSAGEIIKKTGLQSSTVYHSLDGLVSKGLASHVVKANIKHFRAAPPEEILEFLEEKKKAVGKILPELMARYVAKEAEQAAFVFEGFKGMKTAFDDILKTVGKGGNYVFFGAGVGAMPEKTREFFTKYHLRREKLGIKLKIIFNEAARKTLGKDRAKQKLVKVRYLPEEYSSPVGVAVYGDKVLIVMWTESPVAFMIKSVGAARGFKKYFNLLWKSALA